MKKTITSILIIVLAFTMCFGISFAFGETADPQDQNAAEPLQTEVTEPGGTTDPAEPSQPSEPGDPTQPADSTEPAQPAEPSQSAEPSQPAVTVQPAAPKTPAKQVIKSLLPGSKKLTVQWAKAADSRARYEIQICRNKKFNKGVITLTAGYSRTDITRTKLKNKKIYYVRVRTYIPYNGKNIYGAWSGVKKVKVRSTAIYKNTTIRGLPELRVLRTSDDGDLLVLVNKYYGVSKKYTPKNLVSVPSSYGTYSNIKLKKQAFDAYKTMLAAAKKEGLNFKICSAYRTYGTQKSLFFGYKKSWGLKRTYLYSAYPGRSEHHTGLAIDLLTGRNGWRLDDSFAKTRESKWVAANCAKYGFIIRYPKNKTNITGYAYEPWHLRYVGTDAAKTIMSKGITLEEYLGKLP